MSKRWPSSRLFVDKSGSILDSWNGPLQQLEPLLALSVQDFATLQALIRAAQTVSEEDPFSLSAAIAALTVDAEPDSETGYVVTYDGSAARRSPISAISGAPVLLDTVTLSGTTTDVAIPPGFTHAELLVKGASSSAGGMTIKFSEDGGANFVLQSFGIFNAANTQTGSDWWDVESVAVSSSRYGSMTIYSYMSGENKFVKEQSGTTAGQGWAGSRVLTSTAPINLVQYGNSSGVFDAGSIELWGMP